MKIIEQRETQKKQTNKQKQTTHKQTNKDKKEQCGTDGIVKG